MANILKNTDDLEREAVEWIREKLSSTDVLVCISGGKDSIVIEKLAGLSGIRYSINSTLTGIDPPQLTTFIRKNYPACSFVRPRQSFWHLITTHNPPAGTGRGIKWCCNKIKENPSKTIWIDNRIMGIRAEESPARAKYGRINVMKNSTHVQFYPIFDWKEYNIWEFIEKHNLPYPSLYDEGFDRLGCVICPNHQNKHAPYRDRWPNHFKCFEKYTNIWFEKRKAQGKNMWFKSAGEFIENWYTGRFYYYVPEEKI